MQVTYLNEIPAGFLDLDPRDFHTIFSGPTIIELAGVEKQPLFISTLLHGNETSGIFALQMLLKKYCAGNETLPRSVIIFLGNLSAAKDNLRALDGQPDYNRIWGEGDTDVHTMAQEVKQFAKNKNIFACIDIHNNTGWNPYYGCINTLENQFLNLTKLFSRRVVYFIRPTEVLSIAFKEFTTAITLECGQSGDMMGIQRCVDFLEAVLLLDKIDDSPISNDEVSVFHSVAAVKVPDSSSMGFTANAQTDFRFVPNLESLNFMELPEHSLIGWRSSSAHKLIVADEKGNDVADQFINYDGHEIRIKRPIVPSMLNVDERIIRQDCLGYFMQRYQL